jgi:hypothetical protein
VFIVLAGLVRQAFLLLFKSERGEQFRIIRLLRQRLRQDFFRLGDGMLRSGSTQGNPRERQAAQRIFFLKIQRHLRGTLMFRSHVAHAT